MFNYARSDTHFLLYIYDNLRNNLLAKSDPSLPEGNLIEEVLQRSKLEALQRYEWPFYDAQRGKGTNGWYNLLERAPALFNKEQFAVFRAVHQWRDQLARKEDESTSQIMTKQAIFNIARHIPMDTPSLLGCLQSTSVPVRPRIGDLLRVIKEAKIAGTTGSEMMEFFEPIERAHKIHHDVQTIQNSFPSVLATANNSIPSIQVPRSNLSLRTNISKLWGMILDDSTSLEQSLVLQTQHERLRLVLPLPPLTAEIFKDSTAGMNSVGEINQHDPDTRAEHQYVRHRRPIQNDVFIVQQAGGSRKRKADDMEDFSEAARAGAPTNPVVIDSEHEDEEPKVSMGNIEGKEVTRLEDELLAQQQENRRLKEELRKERKRNRKLVREELKKLQGVHNGDDGAEEAFDYANAPSILHAKRGKNDQTGVNNSFNPYAKSLDTSKGMRKMQKGGGGKSFTFKN